jgi:CubicO group peptidase (beta-lactamase class C family)
MSLRLVVVGMVISAFLGPLAAHAAPATPPQDLNAQLEPIRHKHDLPALAAAIVTGERMVALGVVGVRKYGANITVTLNDQFHLGSCTKSMTAMLIAMLVEQGKLAWTTTLAQALPDLAATMQPAYRQVTLEQLMAHRSGMSGESWPQGKTFLDMQRLSGTPRQQRLAYARMILQEPPVSKPGSRTLYSNRNFALAGVIAERVADLSWEDLMQQKLFKPLGMTTAGFGAMGTPGKIDQPWQHRMEGTKCEPIEPGLLSDNPVAIAPAGLVHCSIGDWAKYIQAHLRGEQGRPGLLKPETFRKLHTPPQGDNGFGWVVLERDWGGGRVLTHAGSNNQNYAVVWIAPVRDFAILVMTNRGGDDAWKACDETVAMLIGYYQRQQPAPRN